MRSGLVGKYVKAWLSLIGYGANRWGLAALAEVEALGSAGGARIIRSRLPQDEARPA